MSKWIPVEERLPADEEEVLIHWIGRHGDRGQAVAIMSPDGWSMATPWCGSSMPSHIGEVTHWMPLPPPPQ